MKLDKKFAGVLTKAKDQTVVPEDEWILFLAKDTAFAMTLPTYLENCIKLGADDVQIKMVHDLIARVGQWRHAHPDRCKVPDAQGEKVLP